MKPSTQDFQSLRFSTQQLPRQQRLPALQGFFEQAVQLNIAAAPGHAVTMSMHRGPGLRWARMLSSLTARMERPKSKLADGEDTVCLMIKSKGGIKVAQGRREGEPRDGDGVFLVYREPAVLDFAGATYLSVRFPLTALRGSKTAVQAGALCVPRESEALRLIDAYVAGLPEMLSDPRLQSLAASHVHDLVALALDGSGGDVARSGGVRAGRLAAVKAELARDPTQGLGRIAALNRISPRYVQMLFEESGDTFSQHSLNLRLDEARRMLESFRFKDWTITSVALEAGFGDISHFNRSFRRRFDMTPREWRNASKSGVEGTPYWTAPQE
ncbi:MAG: AraC family transcriptional regulator [Beijerinckiaceae bacterium]